MHKHATPAHVSGVIEAIESRELRALNLPGGDHVAIGIASNIPPDQRESLADSLSVMPGVDHVVHVSRPYKLASREFHAQSTIVKVRDVEFGTDRCVVIAGPCAVGSRDRV